MVLDSRVVGLGCWTLGCTVSVSGFQLGSGVVGLRALGLDRLNTSLPGSLGLGKFVAFPYPKP